MDKSWSGFLVDVDNAMVRFRVFANGHQRGIIGLPPDENVAMADKIIEAVDHIRGG